MKFKFNYIKRLSILSLIVLHLCHHLLHHDHHLGLLVQGHARWCLVSIFNRIFIFFFHNSFRLGLGFLFVFGCSLCEKLFFLLCDEVLTKACLSSFRHFSCTIVNHFELWTRLLKSYCLFSFLNRFWSNFLHLFGLQFRSRLPFLDFCLHIIWCFGWLM